MAESLDVFMFEVDLMFTLETRHTIIICISDGGRDSQVLMANILEIVPR